MNKIIVGNLKMNLLTLAERERFVESFKKELKGKKFNSLLGETQMVICAPDVHLENFVKKIKSKSVAVGGQNIFWEDRGSFTGEISGAMLKNLGVEFVIVGHSERRKYFGETNAEINLKIKAALRNKLVPIFCVGETREERENGEAAQIIAQQIAEGFADISAIKAPSIILAYEPVWAVGSDKVPTSDEIMEVRILIRKIFADAYGLAVADKLKVLYGGSVKAASVKQVCLEPGMDGVLVGRESLIPSEFIKIAEIIDKK